MKIAFATTFDSRDVAKWSGTPFHMVNAFKNQQIEVEYVGNLKHRKPLFFKLKQTWKKLTSGQRESPRFNIYAAKQFSKQAEQQLKHLKIDAIVAPQIHPICYLESKKPIALWTDGLYSSLVGFYPGFSSHSATSIEQGNLITQACLSRCSLAIFSSDWAARAALEIYGANTEKVKIIPFGANLSSPPSLSDIREMLKARSPHTVKLLFLGKNWDRKGGDIVFNVAKALHAQGQKVELNFVGCLPPSGVEVPHYIHCHGFVSKRTHEGEKKIMQLLRESHFLFVPSRAEAFGIVFCEANAFGLPCLTSSVGGIPTIVKNHLNGMTFSLDTPVSVYAEYIMQLMQNYSQYEEMALNAFHEFETRLNWGVATARVKKLLSEL